ncbi:hypothetical protein JXA88_05220 [Candidatus Fermentibacteria bacterium]|nr:hypothetical protein [Candidatus Fermentibacteria bacterium]
MRRHALVWAMLVAVVATASSDAESDYWKKWRSEHGSEMFGGPWHFTDYVKLDPVGPAVVGQPVTVRTRAWFPSADLPPSVRIRLPSNWVPPVPPARVKARVFWNASGDTELLSDSVVETYIGPKDTLDVTAVFRSKTGRCLNGGVQVYLYYVVGGVPVRDPRMFESAPKDYWWYAGGGVIYLGPNPLNPAELLDRDQLDLIRRDMARAFEARLAGARAGTVAASEEARAVIDSLLPTVDEPTRRQLGVVCDYLGGKTKTAPRDAALFVGKQISVWARGKEYAWMGGSEQAVAEWAVGAAERGMLDDMYGSTVKRPADLGRDPNAPAWEMYQAVRDARDTKITWEEARERVTH